MLGEAGADYIDGGSLIDTLAGGGNGEPVDASDRIIESNDVIDEAMTIDFSQILDQLP